MINNSDKIIQQRRFTGSFFFCLLSNDCKLVVPFTKSPHPPYPRSKKRFFSFFINSNTKCMETIRTIGLFMLSGLALSSCHKSLSDEGNIEANKARAAQFQASVANQNYKLTAFYSDKAIDYITTDAVVKSETDLWAYVKYHLKDDVNNFGGDASVIINQNAIKIPGNDAPQITRSYSTEYDKSFVYFNFIDDAYKAQQYKLSEFDANKFVIYIDYMGGVKLFSRFEKLQ